MQTVYVVLTDSVRRGTIVKMIGQNHYKYKDGIWIETGIMMDYFDDESPAFELYREISEEEATKLISQMK